MIQDVSLGFSKAAILADDGRHRQVGRFACTQCTATTDVTIRSGESLNPEAVAGGARKRGWEVDARRKNRCRCPQHATRRTQTDTDTEIRKFEAKMTHPIPVPEIVVALREPTADQRAMIRKLLEKHFDEDRGCYLDEYSDDRIAEEAKVPRAVVSRLRDTAYGAIRLTPEMLATQKEFAALKQQIADHLSAAEALMQQVKTDAIEMRRKVSELENKAREVRAA